MADDAEDTSPAPPMRLREKDALALMEILMMRGYFHENSTTALDGIQPTYCKDDALLTVTLNGCYITIAEMRKRFLDVVRVRGRISILESMELLSVTAETMQRHVLPYIVGSNPCEEYVIVYSPNGSTKEVLGTTYIDGQIESLRSQLFSNAENGMMLVSDVAASFFHLPSDITLTLMERHIAAHQDSAGIRVLLTDNAAAALVTEDYLTFVRTKLVSLLNDVVDAPTCIKALAKTNKWEVSWVWQIIKKEGFEVRGEFLGDLFVPYSFIENQRRVVVSTYSMNGFVTSHMCQAMHGISTSQMKSYATQDKPMESYVLLPNCVVNVDVVVAPLLEAVRLAVESKGWLDLKLHLPMELLENDTTDARILVENLVLNNDVPGVACIRSDGALFFSQSMIKDFTDDWLTRLINKLAVSRATELLKISETDLHSINSGSVDVDGSNHATAQSGKERRKGRKSGKDFSNEGVSISVDDIGELPISEVVQALVENYPDLSNLESSSDVLVEICRKAFCIDDIESRWDALVRFEVERQRATDKKLASGSTEQISVLAHGFKSVDAAFEDPGCFAASCYLIQAKAKFLSYALQKTDLISDEMKQQLKLDFFNGCCIDFVYRITRYALFKKNVEDDMFHFGLPAGSPATFYDPVDLGSSSYPGIFLSTISKRNDALAVLQEELPAGVGLALAKLWTLCGETHAQRNNILVENDLNEVNTEVDPVEYFLSHVRENCLIICGLPFAILDKKAEKKFLISRRIRLMQLLDNANDLSTALDYAIMIMYQNCKNMVVSGAPLRGPVLTMLAHERKIPDAVPKELLSLTEKVEQGDMIDFSALASLKELIASSTKGTT